MGKIIKLTRNGVVIATKNGNHITASYDELDFSPKIGDGVKIYTKGDSFLIRKLSKSGVSASKKNFSYKPEPELFKQKSFWVIFVAALILSSFINMLIGILSFICFLGGIVYFVAMLLKGKPKRNAGVVILASFIIFATAASIPDNNSGQSKQKNSHNSTENSLPTTESTSPKEEETDDEVLEPLETKASDKAEKLDEIDADKVFVTGTAPVNIGEPLTVGDVTFIVNSTYTASTLSWSTLNADANGIFLIVDITITNNKDNALRLNTDFFTVLNNDKSYKNDFSPTMYVNDYTSIPTRLNPGVSTQYKIVFDIPESILHSPQTELKVQTGTWGTESGTVRLY